MGSPQVYVKEQHLESHANHPFVHHAILYFVMLLGGVASHLRNNEIQSFLLLIMSSPRVYELTTLHAITRAWCCFNAGAILMRVLF